MGEKRSCKKEGGREEDGRGGWRIEVGGKNEAGGGKREGKKGGDSKLVWKEGKER